MQSPGSPSLTGSEPSTSLVGADAESFISFQEVPTIYSTILILLIGILFFENYIVGHTEWKKLSKFWI